jgi:hypothetical protein
VSLGGRLNGGPAFVVHAEVSLRRLPRCRPSTTPFWFWRSFHLDHFMGAHKNCQSPQFMGEHKI